MNNILVSVNCITYNHEKYIAKTIDSLLNQKTTFEYEILIHDDASSDETPNIIRKYEIENPDKIKVIYQKENQYSKGKKVSEINLKRAMGKYIAICEGDDFWNDPLKLQKQVDILEDNPDFSGCVHSSYIISDSTTKIKTLRPSKYSRVFKVEEIIEMGGGIFATNSLMYRNALAYTKPPYFYVAPVGDYPMFIHLALSGNLYYHDEILSTYRVGAVNSWTNATLYDKEKIIQFSNATINMLDVLNEYTDGKYENIISKRKCMVLTNSIFSKSDYNKLIESEFYKSFYKLTIYRKFILKMKIHFPGLYFNIKRIKRVMNI